jgi:formylglycine-generating enzyme required for sulfatase activity
MVNRNPYDVAGRQIAIPHQPGLRYFDVYHGAELKPEMEGGNAVLSIHLEALAYGAVFAATTAPADLSSFLAQMRSLAATPLRDYSHEWKVLPQQIVAIAPTRRVSSAPEGMVEIPAGSFDFRVSGIEIEGGNDDGVDVQYPWEPSPRRHHRRKMEIAAFFIDKYPVTNAQFKKFLDAAGYRPADDHNFLRDWRGGAYPDGWAGKPVTWVSLEDARAYAAWAGKRLPHEWEWQYAAQGTDGRAYPWGNEWDPSAVPAPDTGRNMRAPDNVDAHPRGASPFGVMDLAGNVWQWTEEFTDEHTRAAILRGGSFYKPQGSHWYFPQAYPLTEHGKYLLTAPSKDRSGTVGFRCAADK